MGKTFGRTGVFECKSMPMPPMPVRAKVVETVKERYVTIEGPAVDAFMVSRKGWVPPRVAYDEDTKLVRTQEVLARAIRDMVIPIAMWWHGRHHDDRDVDCLLDFQSIGSPLRLCERCEMVHASCDPCGGNVDGAGRASGGPG